MDSLRVMDTHGDQFLGLELSLRLSLVDQQDQFLDVLERLLLLGLLEPDLKVHGSLLLVHLCSDVSGLKELLAEPVSHRENVLKV